MVVAVVMVFVEVTLVMAVIATAVHVGVWQGVGVTLVMVFAEVMLVMVVIATCTVGVWQGMGVTVTWGWSWCVWSFWCQLLLYTM